MPAGHVEPYPRLHRHKLYKERRRGLVCAEQRDGVTSLLLGEEAHVLVPLPIRFVAMPNVCPPLLPRHETLAYSP